MDSRKIQIGDESIVVPLPVSYKDCIALLKSDYFRIGGG